MKYAVGKVGRVIVVRLDHGDDIIGELKNVIKMERVRCGLINLVGALRRGKMVTGPEKAMMPPEPHFEQFDDGRELVAIGTIFWEGDNPAIHIHGGVGRGRESWIGCLRESLETFVVVEAFIYELEDISACRRKDERSGFNLLDFD